MEVEVDKLLKLIHEQRHSKTLVDKVKSFLYKYESEERKFILNTNAKSPKEKDFFSRTALAHACEMKNENLVRCLLDAGSDVYADSSLDPLTASVREPFTAGVRQPNRQRIECIKMILNAMLKNDDKGKDSHFASALKFAIENSYLETFQIFVDMKVFSTPERKAFALNMAVEYFNPYHPDVKGTSFEIPKQAIMMNGTLNVEDRDGKTPLMVVNHCHLTKLLIEWGADINYQNCRGETALMVNMISETVQDSLMSAAPDPYLTDNKGQTALEHYYNDNSENMEPIVKWLVSCHMRQIYRYFFDNSWKKIRACVQYAIKCAYDDPSKTCDLFPIKNYHVLAVEYMNTDLDLNGGLRSIKSKEYRVFLIYFLTSDFQEKFLTDVLAPLSEDNASVNGELLVGLEARATTDEEKNRMQLVLKRLDEMRSLAQRFQKQYDQIRSHILEFVNKTSHGKVDDGTLNEKFENELKPILMALNVDLDNATEVI